MATTGGRDDSGGGRQAAPVDHGQHGSQASGNNVWQPAANGDLWKNGGGGGRAGVA